MSVDWDLVKGLVVLAPQVALGLVLPRCAMSKLVDVAGIVRVFVTGEPN